MLGIRDGHRRDAAGRLERGRRRCGQPGRRVVRRQDLAERNSRQQHLDASVPDVIVVVVRRLSIRHSGRRQLRGLPVPGPLRSAVGDHAGRLRPGLPALARTRSPLAPAASRHPLRQRTPQRPAPLGCDAAYQLKPRKRDTLDIGPYNK